MAGRPVRLTFPSNDIGWARIMAGDVQVGYVHRAGRGWHASLWTEAGNRNGGRADAPVAGRRLEDLRVYLRKRVETKGPWWTA